MLIAALSNTVFTTAVIGFDDVPGNCSEPGDQNSPFDHIPVIKLKGVEIPLHILQPFEEAINSAKTVTEAHSNSMPDCGTLSIPVAFNATLRRPMTLAAENPPGQHDAISDPMGSLVDYDPREIGVSFLQMTPQWWYVWASRILRLEVSPSGEIIEEFLLDFVQHLLTSRCNTYDIEYSSNLQQGDTLNPGGIEYRILHGKAGKEDMEVVRTVLTDYLNGSWVDWLKKIVDARCAAVTGTAMYGQTQLRASRLSAAYDGHLEL